MNDDAPGVTGSVNPRAWTWALALVFGGVAVRAVLAVVVPLFPDETYYWEWSRHLAFGYYDHPPGVAFLIGGGTALLGDTAAGIRAGAVVAGGIGSLAAVILARRIGGDGAALRAAIVLACMPLAAAGLLLTTPDAPLLLSASLTFLALDRALASEPGSRADTGWWLVAGMAAGLGFMAKLTGLLVPFGITVAFVLRRDLRARLATPGPWLAAVAAVGLFLPFLAWNAANEWISFTFQLGHGLGSGGGSAILRELELLGGQMGLVSPILFVLMAMAVYGALRDENPRRAVLAISACAIAGVFVVSALRKPVEANWPAAAYVPGTVVLATAVLGARSARWFRWGAGLGAFLIAAVYVQALVPWMPLPADDDPISRAHGWDELAAAVGRAEMDMRADGCGTVWLGARTYQAASETSFHLPGQPFVLSTNLFSRANQYDAWPGFEELVAPGDCLVLFGREPGTAESEEALRPYFEATRPAPVAIRTRAGREIDRYNIWLMRGWLGDTSIFR